MNKRWIALLLMLAMVCVGAAAMATGSAPDDGSGCDGENSYGRHSFSNVDPYECQNEGCDATCPHNNYQGAEMCHLCGGFVCPHETIDDEYKCTICEAQFVRLVFDLNDAQGGTAPESVYVMNSAESTGASGSGFQVTYTLPAAPDDLVPPENNTFIGWMILGVPYSAEDVWTVPAPSNTTGEVTVTARWKVNDPEPDPEPDPDPDPKTYTVTFMPNGASGSSYTQDYTEGVSQELTPIRFAVPQGYKEFAFWHERPDGTTESSEWYIDEAFVGFNENTTLYAIWSYELTIDYDGAEDSDGETSFTFDQIVKEMPLPTAEDLGLVHPDGRTFKQWLVNDVPYQPGQTAPMNGKTTIKAVWNELRTQIVTGTIDSIPEDIMKDMPPNLDTADEIIAHMENIAVEDGFDKENVLIEDVTLQIFIDGKWENATEENFPEEGITVALDLPEGTNAEDYEFVVTHMFMHDSDKLGTKKGAIEQPKVSIVDGKIVVTLKGLSPVSRAWKVKPSVPVSALPQTGDPSSLMAWVTLLGASGLGMKVIRRRKK